MNEKKEIELVKYEMEIPKEVKEAIDLLDAFLAKVIAGEHISSFKDLIDEVYLAVDGSMKIGMEVKSQYKDEIAGYLTHKLMGTLLK